MLPIHTIGVRASGDLPFEKLGLQYSVEVGNGRSYTPGAEPVLNRIDADSGKAVNVALTAAPGRFPGLHLGVSVYHDQLKLNPLAPLEQTIYAGHAVYDRGRVEFLNEAVWMRNAGTNRVSSIAGGYTQFALRLGLWSPYARGEYLNAPGSDPIARLVLPANGVRKEFSGGLRYDFSPYAALKFQYGRLFQETLASRTVSSAQLAFTF